MNWLGIHYLLGSPDPEVSWRWEDWVPGRIGSSPFPVGERSVLANLRNEPESTTQTTENKQDIGEIGEPELLL